MSPTNLETTRAILNEYSSKRLFYANETTCSESEKNRTLSPWNYITAKSGGKLEGKDMESAYTHVATKYFAERETFMQSHLNFKLVFEKSSSIV